MKYKKQVAFALLCFTSQGWANDTESHTFFTVIPQHNLITNLTENLLVDQAQNNGRALKRRTIQFAVFGGKSTNNHKLRNYFLYGGKNGLVVKETPTLQGGTANNAIGNDQDLIASDFNIQTLQGNQTSTIYLNPSQTVSAAAISIRVPVFERFWASLEAPIVHVRNNLDFVESMSYRPIFAANPGGQGFWNLQTGIQTTPVNCMVAAMQQQGMNYGRIEGVQSATHIADLNFKFGMDFVDQTDFYLSGYAGFVFPTGNKPKAEYVFEAIVGNNKHFGLLGGLYGQLSFEDFGHGKVWLGWLFEGQYLFSNTQTRSFDLKNRPWSRYMQVYWNEAARQDEIAGGLTNGAITNLQRTWGINFFTQDVKVHPGYNGRFDVNINYVGDNWHSGLGLNTYIRQAEDVCLKNPWNLGPQVAGLPIYNKTVYNGTQANQPGGNDPLRVSGVLGQSNEQIAQTAVPVYVLASDLDLESAAHPAVYSQTVYASLGYYHEAPRYPQNFELSALYEWGSTNTVLNRWTIAAKFQLTF